MKHLRIFLILPLLLLFQNCIQDDIIEDRIEEELSFNTSIKELLIKKTFQYDTKYIDNVGKIQTPKITWTSSNPTIISVSNNGLITALKLGNAIITASVITESGKIVSNQNEINIIETEEKLVINNLIQNLIINITHQYTTTYINSIGENETPEIAWNSSNPAIISVTNTGLITANSLGEATITTTVIVNNKNIISENTITVVGIAERLSINNPIDELNADINQTHQYTTSYTDISGQVQTPQITWTSSDTNIASVSANGLVTAINSGVITITATFTSSDGQMITDQDMLTINGTDSEEKSGVIKTTSNYALSGSFTLKEISGTNDLELSINADYSASTALPGLYLYMTNNINSVANAKEIQKIEVFNGAHTYIIKDTGINDFNHLLYWCKPFGVKVGDGEIE